MVAAHAGSADSATACELRQAPGLAASIPRNLCDPRELSYRIDKGEFDEGYCAVAHGGSLTCNRPALPVRILTIALTAIYMPGPAETQTQPRSEPVFDQAFASPAQSGLIACGDIKCPLHRHLKP